MAAYEDDIQLTVGLEPGDVLETSERLNKEIEKIFSKSKGQGTSATFKSLLKSIDTTFQKSKELQTQIENLQSSSVATQQYETAQKEFDKLSAKLDALVDKQVKFLELGGNKNSMAFKGIQYDIHTTTEQINALKANMQDLRNAGQHIMSGADTKQYQDLINKLNQVNNQLVIYRQKALEAGQVDFSTTEASMETVGQTVERDLLGPIESIKVGFSMMASYLPRLGGYIASAFGSIRDWAQKTGDSRFFSGLVSGATSAVNSLNAVHGGILRLAASIVSSGLQKGLQTVQSLANRAFSGMASAAKSAVGHINSLRQSLFSLVGSKITAGLTKIKDSLFGLGKSAKSANSGLNVGFKTFLRYGLGVRSVFALVNKLRRALMDGFKNLAKSNSEFNQAMSQITSSLNWIKNSFAAAFAPLVESLAPVIATIAEKLVSVIRLAGQFISAITGKNVLEAQYVYTDYAESLDKSSKSSENLDKKSKKLQKTLAGFDDVEILKDNKDDDDKETTPDYAFEPGTITTGVADLANSLKEKLLGLLQVVKDAWEKNGKQLIESMQNALSAVKTLLTTIGQTFYDVFTQGYGFDWLTSVFDVLRTIFDIITAIATAFTNAWIDNNNGYNYVASLFTMFTSINELLVAIGQSFINAWNDNGAGQTLISSILIMLTNVHNTISSIATAFKDAWNDGGRGQRIIGLILVLLTTINQIIGKITEDFGKAFASQRGRVMLTSLFDALGEILNIIVSIAEAFKNAWDQKGLKVVHTIFFTLTSIHTLLGSIAVAFRHAWEDKGRGEEIIEHILDLFSKIAFTIGLVTRTFASAFASKNGEDAIGALLDLFDEVIAILGTIADAFVKAWQDNNQGYDYVKSIFDLLTSISGTLESIGTAFRDAWEDEDNGAVLIALILKTFEDINNSIAKASDAFKVAWEDNGHGQELIESIDNAFKGIIRSIDSVATDFGKMFDDDSSSQAIGGILTDLKTVSDTLGTVAESFDAAWNDDNAGYDYLVSIQSLLSDISDFLFGDIVSSFQTAWAEGKTGQTIIQNIIDTAKEFNGMISGWATSLSNAWNEGGRGIDLWQEILTPVKTISEYIKDISADLKVWAEGLDFSPMFTSFDKVLEALQPLSDLIGGALKAGYDEVLIPLGSWTIEEALPAILETLANTLTLLTTALDGLKSVFTPLWENILKPLIESAGDTLIDIITKLNDVLSELADWLSEHQTVFEVFVDVLTAFAAVWLGAKGIGAATGVIEGVASALGALASGFNPVTAGIVVVITAGLLLIQHWDEVKEGAKQLRDWVVKKWGEIKTAVLARAKSIKDVAGDRWNTFIKGTKDGVAQLKKDVSEDWETLKTNVIDGATEIKLKASDAWKDTKKNVNAAVANIKKVAGDRWKTFKDGTIEGANQLKEDVTAAFAELPGKIETAVGSLYDIASNLIGTFLEGLESRIGEISGWFDGVGGKIGGWIKDAISSVVAIPGKIANWASGATGNIIDLGNSIRSLMSYATGGFPTKGQLFMARENGMPEMVGKIGNSTAVANNQQIIEGIKAGVLDALQSVSNYFNQIGTIANISNQSLGELYRLNNSLTTLSQQSIPLVAQGKLLPTSTASGQMSSDLAGIKEALEYRADEALSIDELRVLLTEIARNYFNTSFYIGDEQIARHANSGNLKLSRIYGTN